MDSILIEGLELECIVGVRPLERRRPQRIRIDLDLGLDLSEAGRTGRISHTCDYDRVTDEVRALLRFREYRLIEVATAELAGMLFGVHGALQELKLRLSKPTALNGRARSAGVHVSRRRSHFPTRREPRAFGEVETLLQTHEAGLYLLHLASGQRIAPTEPCPARVLSWAVRGEFACSGGPLAANDPIGSAQPGFFAHENPGSQTATLFCCACPDWLPH
jgi:dihydroneopterin aldolase